MGRTILVGFDRSRAGRNALHRAVAETGPDDALVVLAVLETPVDVVAPRSAGLLGDGPDVPAGLPEPPEITEALDRARKLIADTPVRVAYDWAVGDVGGTIINVARTRGADLIVLGRHEHGLVAQFLGGDTADEVSHHAGCEVVLVDE